MKAAPLITPQDVTVVNVSSEVYITASQNVTNTSYGLCIVGSSATITASTTTVAATASIPVQNIGSLTLYCNFELDGNFISPFSASVSAVDVSNDNSLTLGLMIPMEQTFHGVSLGQHTVCVACKTAGGTQVVAPSGSAGVVKFSEGR